jgi:hypothetical protein
MNTDLIRHLTPEEKELNKKREELAALEASLAQRELDLATFRAELHAFEIRYIRVVGSRYAELDEIRAQIAELQARLNPEDQEAQERASEYRSQAKESANEAGAAQEPKQKTKFKPSKNLKKLYREIAKLIHPDLTTDASERARRHRIMAEVNRAYEAGDEDRLRAILQEWENDPESIKDGGIEVELIRVIRKIAQVEERFKTIEAEIGTLKISELHQLRARVEQAETEGHDLLTEMATQVTEEIAEARKRLEELRLRAAPDE